jgi:hypothetical protein
MRAFVAALFRAVLLAASLALPVTPVAADELAAFHAAVERASVRYRAAMNALETQGREETSAQVALLRQEWQRLAERFAAVRPTVFADDKTYAGTFTQVDASLVGALIVIDIGSREAARKALGPIGETLTRLSERSAPTE